MSSVAISGNASGAGVLTIAAPNTASNYTLTLPTQTGTLVSGTSTAGVVAPAGTTSLAPILLTSGTNLTSATAGAIEYSSPIFTGTPIGTQRGIVPTQQYYRLDSGRLVASTASAVSMFGVGCTLSASTVYEFEIWGLLNKTDGTTSHTLGFSIGGTATLNNLRYNIIVMDNTTGSSIGAGTGTITSSTASNTTFTSSAGANTTIFVPFLIKGTVSINAGGTFIPQYTCSSAPGGSGWTTAIGSYIRINPLSASGAATNVGTWA